MRRPLILLFLLAFLQGALLAGDAPALRDGDVREWKDGRPVHWDIGVGATTGEGPSSRVERGEEGGVRLAGDAATRTWSLVSQRLDTTTGTSYRLSFEVRVADVRREGGQSDNAYVGVRSSGEAGRPVVRIETPWRTAWTPAEVLFKGTSGGDEAVAFLSKSGSLEARRFVLEALAPKDSFDVLASNLGRYYAQFAARPDVDWPRATARSFPPTATSRSSSPPRRRCSRR
jgi:hypothetical protein